MHKLIFLLFFPYAISLPASDLDAGHTYVATITAPAGASVELRAPAWITVGAVEYIGGGTFKAEVTALDVDAYGRVELSVDGVLRASTGVRVGTPGDGRVWLPVTQRSPG